MFCKKCGKEIEEGLTLCEECNASEEVEEVEVVVVEEPEAEVKVEKKCCKKGFGIAATILGFACLFVPILNTVTAILAIVFGIFGRKSSLGVVGLVAGVTYFVNQVVVSIMAIGFSIMYFGLYFFIFFMAMLSSGAIR
jgi:hypothetical protein